MSFKNPDKNCDFCDNSLKNWDYRYNGKHYCRRCYELNFRLKVCTVCGKQKRIHRDLKNPVCKICQVKDKPCIRCGREIKYNGKITENGPVCSSCSKYFREQKRCPVCNKLSYDVFNSLIDGKRVTICQKCYLKRLPTCSLCRRKKPTYTTDAKGKSICKKCATQKRICKQCRKEFPAGRGKICFECANLNGLKRKANQGKNKLSSYFSDYFVDFSNWLMSNRGSQFASLSLLNYLPYFQKLDQIALELGRLPNYQEIVEKFNVAITRKYLLATRYLEEKQVIEIDTTVKEEFANWDMIDRYLATFPEESFYGRAIKLYFKKLNEKLEKGKTSIRSIRLALTPAIKFFKYCKYCKEEQPKQELLKGYLWIYPGQKNAITGFINFLNSKFKCELDLKVIKKPVLERPKRPRKYLEQRLIKALRDEQYLSLIGKDDFLRIAIGYFHWVDIPVFVKIGFCKFKKKQGDNVLSLAGYDFFIPEEIIINLKKHFFN